MSEHDIAGIAACIFYPLLFIGLAGTHGVDAVWAWVEPV